MRGWCSGVVGCLLVTAGCKETISSENVATSDIVMDAEVVADDTDEVVVSVILKVGGRNSNTYAVLNAGDTLVARAGQEEKTMSAVTLGEYEATFEPSEPVEYQISLVRPAHEDAVDNMGTLPDPFKITSMYGAAEEDAISREKESMEVTWDPSGTDDDMSLEARKVGCFFLERSDIPGDTGSFTLPANELSSADVQDPEICNASLFLWRTRLGSVDPGLGTGSVFRLRQVRETGFVSGP